MNSSELWDRTAVVSMVFGSSTCFTNKNKLCLFAHQSFVSRGGDPVLPNLASKSFGICELNTFTSPQE